MKIIEYDGLTFVRDDRTGYYLNSRTHKRLHRYVWEKYNGVIPNGYDVHHIDRNKGNNDISNLQLLPRKEHLKLHGELQTEGERQRKRENLNLTARPKACEWHGSEEGRKWHSEHGKKVAEQLQERKYTCLQCGKEFYKKPLGQIKFCCNACKSAYRRKMGYDNVTRICACCGKEFVVNKYSKIRYCSRACTMRDRKKK